MTPAWQHLLAGGEAYKRVEARLIDRGSVLELEILRRMSAQEIDVLIRQERGLG